MQALKKWAIAPWVVAASLVMGASAAEVASSSGDSDQLAEITVTAQKRSETAQAVPIAIVALPADSLAAQRVENSKDLSFTVPSLNYSAAAGFAEPYLRGIGTDITQPNSDPSVATYMDGVFLANDAGTIVSLLGVDRIEVLLGPQGTLYGKNAVGGTINIVTRTPSATPEGEVTIGAGNYNEREISGYVSGPIADNLYGGIYVLGRRFDSYYNQLVPVNERVIAGTPDHEYSEGVRGKLVFEADRLRLIGSLEYTQGASADAGILQNIQPTSLGNVVFHAPFVNQHLVADNDGATYNKPTSTLAILRAEYDLGWSQIVSITSWRDLKVGIASDFDGTTSPLIDLVAVDDSKDYSQELQLQSRPDSKIKWIVGAYGFYEDGGFLPTASVTGVLFAPLFGPGEFANVSDGSVITKSWAPFGQATLPLFDSLNLTLGARYSHDDKTMYSTNGFATVSNGWFNYPLLSNSNYPVHHADWSAFTPKVTLDYKISDTMLYFTYSKGYKPGTFNVASPATPGPVKPEFLTSFEVGSKSDFFDHRTRLNLSAYHYAFTDIQVQVNAQGVGSLAVLQNGAKATAYGGEATLLTRIVSGLDFSASGSAEHAVYDSFPGFAGYLFGNAGNTQVPINASGKQMVRAPKFVVTAGLHYTEPLPTGQTLVLAGDWYHNGGFYWEASNTLREPSYSLFNASAMLKTPSDSWEFAIWGKNLADKWYHTVELLTAFGTVANDADPRTFGFTVSRKF